MIVEQSTSVGFERLDAYSHIVAMGDFNSDKHTDMFVLNTGNATHLAQSLEVWLWTPAKDQFVLNSAPSARIDFPHRNITNVVPGDWNYDGKLDVLVSGPAKDAWQRDVNRLMIYLGDHVGFDPTPLELPPSNEQVLVCDVNNDLKLDLFGQKFVHDAPTTPSRRAQGRSAAERTLAQEDITEEERVQDDAVDRAATHRVYWMSAVHRTSSGPVLSFQVVPQPLDQSYPEWPARSVGLAMRPQPTLAVPHSHAWVDLNGDCMADLLVTSADEDNNKYIELWINRASIGPVFDSISVLPTDAGQISVADLDNDGNVDILFPVFGERTSANEIHMYYNHAQQLCRSQFDQSKDGQTGCIPESNLCTPDDDFTFDFMRYQTPSDPIFLDSADTVVYQFPQEANGGLMYSAYVHQPDQQNPATATPFQLRLGDINLDGFPDILLALTPTPVVPGDEYGVAELWYSVACKTSGFTTAQAHVENVLCSPAAEARGRRVFSSRGLDQANNLLSDVSGAYAGASFFDLSDDGEMDIVFSAIGPTSGTYSTHVFVNNFNDDAYFLTTIASNGVCPAWCDTEPRHPSPKPYGVNMVGATFKLAFTDLAGNHHMAVGSQLTQSAYLTLQTPYVTFGLGRTNTFIDSFFFGIALNASQHSRAWVSVVPNSQIIIFPYPPGQPDEWTLELFISPTSHLFWVCIAWAALLTVLAIVIGYLHLQEKREDEKEKRKHQLLFTF